MARKKKEETLEEEVLLAEETVSDVVSDEPVELPIGAWVLGTPEGLPLVGGLFQGKEVLKWRIRLNGEKEQTELLLSDNTTTIL